MHRRRTVSFDDLHAFLELPEHETIEYVTSYLGATHLVIHTSGADSPVEVTQVTTDEVVCTRTHSDGEPPLPQ